MSASEIIREIERLSSQEKSEVLSALLRSQANRSKLSREELVALADQMVAAKDSDEADRIEALGGISWPVQPQGLEVVVRPLGFRRRE